MHRIPSISSSRSRRPQHIADQYRLFGEIIESITTTDRRFEDIDGTWGSRITRPPGRGWRVADFSHDKRTRWMRRVPIPWPARPSVCGRWQR